MSSAAKNIFNIPAGQPFAKLLAASLLQQYQDKENELAQVLLLLPTRRACRVLRESFVELRAGKPLILPRMQPVGDLDEEELSLSILAHAEPEESWSLPPPLPPLRRQIMLAKHLGALYPRHSTEQRLKLAQALGHLMDQVYTENLDLKDLADLVPEGFASHWQITLEALKAISEHWPGRLKELGMIDHADRRNRLILKLAQHWQEHPPAYPVIGAGSTGSIPSTRQLLSVIATLPQGSLILPGLDSDMDEDSWSAMDETHPQFGLKQLLDEMQTPREAVKTFDNAQSDALNENRQILTREIMRPAQTSKNWANLPQDTATCKTLQDALKDLNLLECDHGREEAEAIAIMLRETLNQENKTACLITPDRTLAARVTENCERWGITVDDSAGLGLDKTPLGIFMQLALDVTAKNAAPIALLSLLKHPFCNMGIDLYELDIALRGTRPSAGFVGLKSHIESQERLDSGIKNKALSALESLQPILSPFIELRANEHNFTALLSAHIALCETLYGSKDLWQGDDGRNAAAFFAELFDHTGEMDALDLLDYADTLRHFMSQSKIRPAFGTHPRLQILGQLEARLIDADLVILGGLNEGVWPPEAQADPWMSRPMRKNFGLPSIERGIGLAAHDFAQGLCAPKIVITRALNNDNVPTVPSRWLQRLDAVLQAADIDRSLLKRDEVLHWARSIDEATTITPAARPMPKPPVDKRPRRLSVTRIETWLRDPYSIYARHILGLTQTDPLEKEIDAAERGNMLHKILERFISENKKSMPVDAAARLVEIAEEKIAQRGDEGSIWSFWLSRFNRTAHWLASHEAKWREQASVLDLEAEGHIIIKAKSGDFKLTAIADRIDAMNDGTAAIIDYKSGGSYAQAGMQDGRHPQLPLEAVILAAGGFENIPARQSSSLQYWVLSGSEGGKPTVLNKDVEALTQATRDCLQQLIESYDDPGMPYICLPRSDSAPRFNDYEHLARVKEWAITEDEEDAA